MLDEVEWGLDDYVEVCKDYFRQRSFSVEQGPSLDPAVRWRPHLLVSKADDIRAVEIRVAEDLPNLWLMEMEKARARRAGLRIYLAIPAEAKILSQVLAKAQVAGLGIYEIEGTILNERLGAGKVGDKEVAEELERRLPMLVVDGDTPYGNIRNLRKILRRCKTFIHWLDKHFDRAGIERIYEEIEEGGLTEVREIHVACGLYENNITRSMRSDVKRFVDEVANREIAAAVRVVCDRKVLDQLHDRFILTESAIYSVMPVNAIEMGQFGQLFQTKVKPPFQRFWESGYDLIDQWAQIEKELELLKKRREESR